MKALDVLSCHKLDKKYFKVRKKNKEMQREQQEKNSSEDEGRSKSSFAQKPKEKLTCYCCGKKGHSVPECEC
jgi:hypothetical protein